MKIVQINATCGVGSTGKICLSIAKLLEKDGIENYVLYSVGNSEYSNSYKFSNLLLQKTYAVISRVAGNNGFSSSTATKRLIKMLDKIEPNVVHLHNLHSNDINLELLFKYLINKKIKIYWTFHDCWAFTGYCMHFDYIKCNKWRTGCYECPQKLRYSWFGDKSNQLYKMKKELYSKLDITIITPSIWMANIVKLSFFNTDKIVVINNGIDLSTYFPQESIYRKKIKAKYIVLGVAFGWSERKGLNSFIYLAQNLSSEYQIVLVGTDEKLDRILPENILSIHRTNNQAELAGLYSIADVFVNPTLEDTFPTVNMEALACGTPVVSFDTGGSAEIYDRSCGVSIEKGDNKALLNAVIDICTYKPFSKQSCKDRAQKFDMWKCFNRYIELYKNDQNQYEV